MPERFNGESIQRGYWFARALRRARERAGDSDWVNDLVERASAKLGRVTDRFDGLRDSLGTCFRLLRDYAAGRYRAIPWSSLVSIVAAIVYFVMPLDAIPDFILGFGLVDDVALLGWVLSSVRQDIDAFAAWEKNQD